MPTLHEAVISIRQKFKDDVELGASGLDGKVFYDNTPKEQPSTGVWARVLVRPTTSEQVSIGSPGSNRFRHHGLLMIELYTPAAEGDEGLYGVYGVIKDSFKSQATIDGVVYRNMPSITVIGRDQKWWRASVSINWYADEIG